MIISENLFADVFSLSIMFSNAIPARLQARCLLRTYTLLAGSSPTVKTTNLAAYLFSNKLYNLSDNSLPFSSII